MPKTDTQLLAEAILQSAAEAKTMAEAKTVTDPYENPDDGKSEKDPCLLAKVRAIRAMQRGNWKPRFQIGDAVECKYQGEWYRATVVQHRYREPDWKTGHVAAYQCSLNHDGTLIYVPTDLDMLVRKLSPDLVQCKRCPVICSDCSAD
jgi:hypothetical protein